MTSKTSAAKIESSSLEFKQEKREKKETFQDIAEASVCFANGAGGKIILGVSDRGTGSDAFLGTDIEADVMKERIYALTQPSLLVTLEEMTTADVRLLIIDVPAGLDVYQTHKTAPTRRLGDQCLVLLPAEVGRLNDERRGADWSADASGRPLEDILPLALVRLRGLLSQTTSPGLRSLAEAGVDEMLTSLRFIHQDGTLTRAAEIMLCGSTQGLPDTLVVYQHRSTTGGEADFVRRWGAPLVQAFPEIMDVIANRIGITPVTTGSGQQIQIEDYPLAAIREALANALMHGDHRESRPVSIEHSPELLTVRSPGPLVTGVLPTNILTHPSKPRFRHLADVFRNIGLAEQLGQGVDRMFREMIRSGRAVPSVEEVSEGQDTLITFTGGPPNSRVARFLATLPLAEQNDTDTLLVTTVLCEKRTITASSISNVLQRSVEATESILRRLATGEAHLLEPTAGTSSRRHPSYRLQRTALVALGPALRYQKRSVNESDAKIVEHVKDYGQINSRTVQRLFDLDVFQARDLLRDLLGRELLIRISEQSRGTAVRYGPGPKFPLKKARPKPGPAPDETLF
nr:RNA-binding domain-containing protein [Arthrobacter sp. 260]